MQNEYTDNFDPLWNLNQAYLHASWCRPLVVESVGHIYKGNGRVTDIWIMI